MKGKILLFALLCASVQLAFAGGGKEDETQRKSFLQGGSFPVPFTQFPTITVPNSTNNRPDKNDPPVSTGYYIVDSDDEAGDRWRPDLFKAYLNYDTDNEPAEKIKWKRIVSGPNQVFPTDDGKPYFRNPGNMDDSTNNALAGPIKIGFPFFFNGVRYDSFYVSQNGVIVLSNTRYVYDNNGNRSIPAGSNDCYNFYREENITDNSYVSRPKIGNGLSDNTPDDYGYTYIACGGNPNGVTAGIRNPNNPQLSNALGNPNVENNNPDMRFSPIIAPLWDDLQCSQDPMREDKDKGQVWYKVANNPDGTRRCIVYFKNFQPIGTKNFRQGTVNFQPDHQQMWFNFQVTMDEADSSVYFFYERLDGIIASGSTIITADEIARLNSTIGVRGYARHYSYGYPNCNSNLTQTEYQSSYPQSSQYMSGQGTQPNVNMQGPAGHQFQTPTTNLAVRFKQWKNVARVVPGTVSFLGRELSPTADLNAFTRNITAPDFIELFAGHAQLGAVRPRAVFQNLTNDIQGPGSANPPRPPGVNYQKQDLNFRVRFRIINQVPEQRKDANGQDILVNPPVYTPEAVTLSNACLSAGTCQNGQSLVEYGNIVSNNFNPLAFPGSGSCPMTGLPPYGFARVTFPVFEPNDLIDNNIGRLRGIVFVEPLDTLLRSLGDEWPFDDTVKYDMFVMRRLSFLNSDGFNDDVNQFHVVDGTPMPSVLKWVNINTEVSDGDQDTYLPPPPRKLVASQNIKQTTIESPVVRMNRWTLGGDIPEGQRGGDQLRSFPIDIRDLPNRPTKGAVLSFSVERTGKVPGDLVRDWANATAIGPEGRIIYNGNPLVAAPMTTTPDYLFLEFARSSTDQIENIAKQSATDINWRTHKRRGGASAITDNAVFSIFGSGGHLRGFLQTDKDSALSAAQGLRANPFDDGKDWEFSRYFWAIPDSVLYAPNYAAMNFRFRLRVDAVYNPRTGQQPPQPTDDRDDFFVDNVKLLYSTEVPDVEISLIEARWPYTMAPATQTTRIPIRFKLVNNTNKQSSSVNVTCVITPVSNPDMKVYCRNYSIPMVKPGEEVLSTMPNWDARKVPPGEYRVNGYIFVNGGDLDPSNDTTYSKITLRLGPVMAYDPPTATNDVPEFTTPVFGQRIDGKGLSTYGYSHWAFPHGSIADGRYIFGDGFGSGQIAMRFTVYNQDTIKGVQAWFGELNQSPDPVSFSLYRDQNGTPASTPMAGSTIIRERGTDQVLNRTLQFGRYSSYLFNSPIVLQPGEYWVSVAQLGLDGMQLGASKARVGQLISNYNDTPPGTFGTSGYHLNLDKHFREPNTAKELINRNVFAYENTRFSGAWQKFTALPNPAFGHNTHTNGARVGGGTPNNPTSCCGFPTFSRGTWLPLLRPYFGDKPTAQFPTYDSANCIVIPVELTYFDGHKRNSGIDLFWQTASEEDNNGFFVERRSISEVGNSDWKALGFIPGAGNSSVTRDYNFFDGDVAVGNTYQYRLMQQDRSGQESCKSISDVLEFTFDGSSSVALGQNSPNPIAASTQISFYLAERMPIKLEVLDAIGNVISTLADGEYAAGTSYVEWNGTGTSGIAVASGTYIYRLTAGGQTLVGKMTVVR